MLAAAELTAAVFVLLAVLVLAVRTGDFSTAALADAEMMVSAVVTMRHKIILA